MQNIRQLLLVILFTTLALNIKPAIHDSRYFPLHMLTPTHNLNEKSHITMNPFFMTANEAFGRSDAMIGIPELEVEKNYNQKDISSAIEITTGANPLRPDWQGMNIPWKMDGSLEAHGLALCYEQAIFNKFSLGFSASIFQAKMRQEFSITDEATRDLGLQAGDISELDAIRRSSHKTLGLENNAWSDSGIGDIEAYVKFENISEYIVKLRKLNAGAKLGIIIPTAKKRDVNNPASLSYGGNKHLGFLIAGDLELGLKEDLSIGFSIQLDRRLPKTQERRIPLADEPQSYGAVVGDVKVTPGITIAATPYVMIENIYEGLGTKIAYNFIHHSNDFWQDRRSTKIVNGTNTQATFDFVNKKSTWTSEHAIINVFYDLSHTRLKTLSFAPTLSITWNIPYNILSAATSVCKTHKFSFGLEFKF